MSITFDQNYFHSICCQTGAYLGWHLVVNEATQIHGIYPRVTLHKSKQQNWTLLEANGVYKITYGGQSNYRGWFLSYVDDEKDQKIGHLCLKQNADQNAYWAFDLVKNLNYDYSKRIVRNYQNNFNLRIVNHKKYIVSKEQFFALIHKNTPIAIQNYHGFFHRSTVTYIVQDSSGNFTWRVQKTELSNTYLQKKSYLQNKVQRLEDEISKKEKEKQTVIGDLDKKTSDFGKFKKQTEASIASNQEEIKKFVERNAFLQAELLLMEKWKANYYSKEKQLQEYTNNFNLRKQQLKLDLVNYTRMKEQVQSNLPRKTRQLNTINQKVSKLNDFEGKEVSLKNFWLQIFELEFEADEKLMQLEKAKNLQNKMILEHEEYINKLNEMIQSSEQPDKITEEFDSVMQQNSHLKLLVEKIQQEKVKLQSEYRKLVEEHYESVDSSRKQYESLRSQIKVLEDENLYVQEQVFKQKLKFEYFKRLLAEDAKIKTVKNLFGVLFQDNIQDEKQSLKAQILELKTKLHQEFNIQTDQTNLEGLGENQLPQSNQNNEGEGLFKNLIGSSAQNGQEIFDVKKRVKNQMLGEKYQLLVKEDEDENEFEQFYSQLKKKRHNPDPNEKRFYEVRRQRRTKNQADWKIEENVFDAFEALGREDKEDNQQFYCKFRQKNPFENLFSFFQNEEKQSRIKRREAFGNKPDSKNSSSEVLEFLGKKYLGEFINV